MIEGVLEGLTEGGEEERVSVGTESEGDGGGSIVNGGNAEDDIERDGGGNGLESDGMGRLLFKGEEADGGHKLPKREIRGRGRKKLFEVIEIFEFGKEGVDGGMSIRDSDELRHKLVHKRGVQLAGSCLQR